FGSTAASRKGMLEVLERAQAAGQKTQQDALIGQASIFDLASEGPDAGAASSPASPIAGGGGLNRPVHPPIPSEEFDQAQQLAAATLARPLHLRVDASALGAGAIDELKQAIEECPGAAEVLLDVETSAGTRRLRLGEAYRVEHTATLRAELEHALAPFAAAAASAAASAG